MRPPTYFGLPLTFLSWASIAFSQCTLMIPQNPLTAQGLATPYELTGCNQLDFANEGVFVEAAIIDPATGEIQIYNPLVINAGMVAVGTTSTSTSTSSGSSTSTGSTITTSRSSSASTATSSSASVKANTITSTSSSSTITSSSGSVKTNNGNAGTIASTNTSSTATKMTPVARAAATQGAGFFIPPIVPTLPANAVVGLWFGSNAQTVTLTGDTATCVNGLGTSVFGQFAYCNAPAWFSAANTAVQKGMTKVSAPGTGDGQACPTIRDFRIVDQDQSDNVVTTYLLVGGTTLAQNTPANSQANPNAEVLSNASDNALINDFIQPTLGCTAYTNPCTTCAKGSGSALATNELQASFFPPAGGPAMVPLNDPMVLVNGQQSLQKVNLYRAGVNQAQADNANASGTTYCQQFAQSGLFISLNQQLFSGTGSPAADQATNLFTFLAMRFSMSFGPVPGLACTQLLNANNPVTLTTDGNGVVTAATINTQQLQQILGGTTTGTTTSATVSGVRLVSTSGAATATPPATTASNTTSATHSSSGTTTATPPTTTAGKTTSVTLSSVHSVSTSSTATPPTTSVSKTTSITLSSIHSVSTSSGATTVTPLTTTTGKTTSVTLSSVHSVSTSSTVTPPTASASKTTSVTLSSVHSVSTSSGTVTIASATTTSSVAVTSHPVVAIGVTSTLGGTCMVTVTVTETFYPPQASPTNFHFSGYGGHNWPRELPARGHSRMQKKNRHSSSW